MSSVADPVDAEEVLDADRGDPVGLLDELEAGGAAVEREPQRQAHQEAEEAEAVRDPAHRVLVLLAPEDGQQQQRARRRAACR